MNRNRIITLADAVESVRPEWSHVGIANHITKLDQTWTGTDAELAAHVMAVAANPAAQTPGAISTKMPPEAKRHQPAERGINAPKCYICGRPKARCQEMQDFEIEHGLPDPHVFETKDDWLQNAIPLTAERKAELMAKIRTMVTNVNDLPGMKHAVESARLAEERAQTEPVKDELPL